MLRCKAAVTLLFLPPAATANHIQPEMNETCQAQVSTRNIRSLPTTVSRTWKAGSTVHDSDLVNTYSTNQSLPGIQSNGLYRSTIIIHVKKKTGRSKEELEINYLNQKFTK
jgi:hypothetical protein